MIFKIDFYFYFIFNSQQQNGISIMSLSRSHGENDDERQKPTFLTKIQEIMAILEEEVVPNVEENTHLKLVNGLQYLYNLHTGSITGYVTRNLTETTRNIIANTPTPPTPTPQTISRTPPTPTPPTPQTISRSPPTPPTPPPPPINTTLTNFNRVLSALYNRYDYWTENERILYDNSVNPNNSAEHRNGIISRFREFSNYNRQMREALGYWESMSPEEQSNIRWGPHIRYPSRRMNESVERGGPIDRIIIANSPSHPIEIYNVLYNN
jgi:hypothetical protein